MAHTVLCSYVRYVSIYERCIVSRHLGGTIGGSTMPLPSRGDLLVGLYHHVIKVEPHRHGNLRAGDNLKLFRFPGIVCIATILGPLQLFFLLH
jgi:hypothetical protein